MMNYEIFKEAVSEKFLSYMKEKYQGMKLKIYPVKKVNRTIDGICLNSVDENMDISPTIYINDMYEHYLETEDLHLVLKTAADTMDKAFSQAFQIPKIETKTAKDNIIFQLVNTLHNEEMLCDIPHRDFLDLSIIYRWLVSIDEQGISSIVINNELAGRLGFSEEQIFMMAEENTRCILPVAIMLMDDIMKDIFINDGIPEELADMMSCEMPEQCMHVITNDKGVNGATSILYEDELYNLAEKIGTDLYILPSSIHEVIAVSINMGDPNELARMVSEINVDQVKLEDRLSNQVYHYDKDLRKFSLATDTPNKSLKS